MTAIEHDAAIDFPTTFADEELFRPSGEMLARGQQ